MLRELSPSELGLWTALWLVNPWGEQRADLRAAIGTAVLANVNRDPAKQAEPFKARDFMPYADRAQVETADARELEARIVAALAGAGGIKRADKAELSRRRREMGRSR